MTKTDDEPEGQMQISANPASRQAGTRQAGTRQAGTRQAGIRQAGTRQAGTGTGTGTVTGPRRRRSRWASLAAKAVIPLTAGLAIAGFAAPSAPAAPVECGSCSAWWNGLSVSRPTDLHGGSAVSAEQELVVNATGGDVVLVEPASLEFFEKGRISFEELRLVEFPYDASVAEVQKAVERLLPGDTVEVSGSVGRYVLTFPGQSVAKINSAFGFLGGLEGEATVTQIQQGKPDGELLVTFENVGDATVDAASAPVEVQDALPAGLRAVSVSGGVPEGEAAGERTFVPIACRLDDASRVGCTAEGSYTSVFGHVVPEIVPPFDVVKLRVGVIVEGSAVSGEVNRASVSGGGVPGASVGFPVTISSTPAPYGPEDYEMANEEAGGAVDAKAGSHPFQQTTTLTFNTSAANETSAQEPALTKDVNVQWPPGLIGDPIPFPRCTLTQFFTNSCPPESIVGVGLTAVDEPGTNSTGVLLVDVPLYDIEPAPGEAARFGMLPAKVPVFLDATVRSGNDYGVTVHVENVTQVVTFLYSEVTVWGTPGAAVHDAQRGEGCLLESRGASELQVLDDEFAPCKPLEESNPPPFLTLPSGCTGEMETSVETDSWQEPRPEGSQIKRAMKLAPLDGCNREPFAPSIEVTSDEQTASTPSGLAVDEHVPQESTRDAAGLAEADQKSITVTLPEGLQLNPSAADGLQACSEAQIGFTGFKELNPQSEPGNRTPQFKPEVYDPETGKNEVSLCPNGAKVATATVKVPVLENPLEGEVYLAAPQNFSTKTGAPQENPFESLVAMYIVARDPVSGVIVKLAGEVELGGEPGVEGLAPGQIRARFANNPQAPFEDAILRFFGGERAPLATPALCRRAGEEGYVTQSAITPWSAPLSDEALLTSHPTSEFDITSGPNGGACPNPPGDQSSSALPFKASLATGTTNNNGGSFSDLSTTLSRPSGNQNIQSVTLNYPPGLSGLLSGVELCPEPQANKGQCGPNSQIGETIVSVGVGGEPFTVTGGKVYITGPYNGTGSCTTGTPGCAPFGLSIVNPAKAGPFDLQEGAPVIVRAKIEVNPETAALTITTNTPAQGDSIPSFIEGFALQIQHVNVLVNREHFTFNPTSCEPMHVTGTIASAEGASVSLSEPFQVANCAVLKFTPEFAVSVSGKTSKANGTSLTAKVTEPAEPQGSQANIAKFKVELPVQLPSRLTTLQKACTDAQFNANPAGCPAASDIGHAVVHTPLLPVPVEGPAIFVSHGGEAFPSLTMVLQGDGVTVDLVGTTYISKAGITSTTFKTVPDVPFSSFELTLHNGPYSALTANTNLCRPTKTVTVTKKVTVKVHGRKRKVTRKVTETKPVSLAMPTEIIAQNGDAIYRSTPIAVSECAKATAAKHPKKKKRPKKKKGTGHGSKGRK